MKSNTVKNVETSVDFIALDLPRIKALAKGEENALAASVFATLECDSKGGFILPSGKDERKILASLVAQGITNPRVGKFIVAMIADGGLAKWLRPYKDTTGLFRSRKALVEYRAKEAERESSEVEISPLPVYVAK